jgi:hypothetical protein
MQRHNTTVWHCALRLRETNDTQLEHTQVMRTIEGMIPGLGRGGGDGESGRRIQYVRVSSPEGPRTALCRITAEQLRGNIPARQATLSVAAGDYVALRFLMPNVAKVSRLKESPASDMRRRDTVLRNLDSAGCEMRARGLVARMGVDADSVRLALGETRVIHKGLRTVAVDASAVKAAGFVRDAEALILAFRHGVGDFRTYGFGMVLVDVLPAKPE